MLLRRQPRWRNVRPLLQQGVPALDPAGRPIVHVRTGRYSTASTTSPLLPSAPIVSWSALARQEEARRVREEAETAEKRRRRLGLRLDFESMREMDEDEDFFDGSDGSDGSDDSGIRGSLPASEPSPGTVLLESLENDRRRRHPFQASSSSASSSSSLSVLVEPVRQYPHPGESRRSRIRHKKSLVHQARLEAIRQVQLRPLPDWRAILRRLTVSTPTADAGCAAPDLDSLSLSSRLASASWDSAPISPLSPTSPRPGQPSQMSQRTAAFTLPHDSLAVQVWQQESDLSDMARRMQCQLRLFEHRPPDRQWLLTVQGREEDMQNAVPEIRRIAPDAKEVAGSDDSILLPKSSSGETEGWTLVRSTRSPAALRRLSDPVFQPYTLQHSARDIPRPPKWTPESLERYVAALINGRLPPHLSPVSLEKRGKKGKNSSSSGGGGGGDRRPDHAHPGELDDGGGGMSPSGHERAVASLLQAVFYDEAAKPALTTDALKWALAYMGRRGEVFRPEARALFVRAEAVGLPLDTSVFNTMLASPVQTRDLRNFGATLLLMRGRRHAPNLVTWLLFLRLFASEEVKLHILHAMHARGLLESPRAMRAIAPEMVAHDAEALLALLREPPSSSDSSDSSSDIWADFRRAFLPAFLDRQTARYGPGWLNTLSAGRILDVLGKHGRFDECRQLLRLMQDTTSASTVALDERSYKRRVEVYAFNVVLTHCYVQNSLSNAIPVVQAMSRGPARVTPDHVTYKLLFEMAFQRRLPHVLAVLWHYACLARLDIYWLRRRVSTILADAVEHPGRASAHNSTTDTSTTNQHAATPPPRSNSRIHLAHTQHLVRGLCGPVSIDKLTASFSSSSFSSSSASSSSVLLRLGTFVRNRLVSRYAGWEPAMSLGDALRDAMELDNALLRQSSSTDAAHDGDAAPYTAKAGLEQT